MSGRTERPPAFSWVDTRPYRNQEATRTEQNGVSGDAEAHGEVRCRTWASHRARLTELPQHTPPVLGQPQKLSLRGVIGFGGVFHIVATVDAELSQTKAAEREFVQTL
jgi:hypothetical protein